MSLVIQASPETTSLFAKTEKWLHGLQQELDLSWAIIMEYYPKKYRTVHPSDRKQYPDGEDNGCDESAVSHKGNEADRKHGSVKITSKLILKVKQRHLNFLMAHGIEIDIRCSTLPFVRT